MVLKASYLWWDDLPFLSPLLILLGLLFSCFELGTWITRSYVSRGVELMRHGHFFRKSLQTLPLGVELICLCLLECILKANQLFVFLSFKPYYAWMLRSGRETGKCLYQGWVRDYVGMLCCSVSHLCEQQCINTKIGRRRVDVDAMPEDARFWNSCFSTSGEDMLTGYFQPHMKS